MTSSSSLPDTGSAQAEDASSRAMIERIPILVENLKEIASELIQLLAFRFWDIVNIALLGEKKSINLNYAFQKF